MLFLFYWLRKSSPVKLVSPIPWFFQYLITVVLKLLWFADHLKYFSAPQMMIGIGIGGPLELISTGGPRGGESLP